MNLVLENGGGESGWMEELIRRLGIRWVVKVTGTIIISGIFFWGYFWVDCHPCGPATVMPRTVLDEWIGFQPFALGLYFSLWVYVGLLPALFKNLAELIHYVFGVIGLSLSGLGAFYYWPTAVPLLDMARMQTPWFVFLKRIDASGNACPSLHVAFAIFTAIGFGRLLREVKAGRFAFVFNILWSAGICYSTVAVRQHVVLDVIAGIVLGGVVGKIVFSARWPTWGV